MTHKNIALIAGGTGGHIFPAFALKEELIKRNYHPLLFTDKRGKILGKREGIDEGYVIASASPRKNIFLMIKALFLLFIGFCQSLYLLRKTKTNLVVGFGGYPTVPTILAARCLSIPIIIHEQNGFMGMANKYLSKIATKIALSFPITKNLEKSSKEKSVLTGMPVRSEITNLHGQKYEVFNSRKPVHIVVIGGSLGAKVFSDIIPQAFSILPKHYIQRLKLTLQTRKDDHDRTYQALAKLGITFELNDFFTNIPSLFSEAHLIISRAGASTLAEIACAGKPAILVPFPQAQDNHQYYNALNIEKQNAAWVMPQNAFTPRALASRLEALFSMPKTLIEAAEASRELGKIDGAAKMADMIERIL